MYVLVNLNIFEIVRLKSGHLDFLLIYILKWPGGGWLFLSSSPCHPIQHIQHVRLRICHHSYSYLCSDLNLKWVWLKLER